jgi:hypothetical protein
LKAAISEGVERGLFAYCVDVSGDGKDVRVNDPSLILFRDGLALDEIDLGPGAALLSPDLATQLLPGVEEAETVEQPEREGEPMPPPAGTDGRRRVQLTIEATKDDLHTVNLALNQLRDLLGPPGTIRLEIRVDADSGGQPIDEARLQNMVLQHLEEDEDVRFNKRLE